MASENENPSGSVNQRQLQKTITDPLDTVNRACDVFKRFLKCLDEHSIASTCLLNGGGQFFRIHTIFHFICYKQLRSTELLHSLRCLQEKWVVDLLVFHLADIYGTSLIDIQAKGTTNALFKCLDSDPLISRYFINPLVVHKMVNIVMTCFPQSVFSHHIPFIVNTKCGAQTADLVNSYYLYFRAHLNELLSEMLGPTNICDEKNHNNILTTGSEDRTVPESIHSNPLCRLFDQFLEDRSPGTAMDTVYGHKLRNNINTIPVEEFCNPASGLGWSFQACTLLSYDPLNKGPFNVLQYAHSTTLPYTDLPQPSSMETLSSCWNVLQQICGANASYFEYSYRVSTDSRQIHEIMNNLTCKWQDMLRWKIYRCFWRWKHLAYWYKRACKADVSLKWNPYPRRFPELYVWSFICTAYRNKRNFSKV